MTPLLWTLAGIQVAMGAFDTIYHHEMTERLAWRASQRWELRLHAVRDWLYALLFLVLGWLEVYGAFAAIIIAVLVVEIAITLMDFVEEDLSRKLPASERINHTLLAINYGAILALLVPVLFERMLLPSTIKLADAGLLSFAATAAAIGAGLFGLRDFAAAGRLGRMTRAPASSLVEGLSPAQTVLVTGATGFIGTRLVAALAGGGHQVIALVRSPGKIDALTLPVTVITSLDQVPAETRIDAIINLAGEPIGNALWTEAKRRTIVESRIGLTAEVVGLIARLDRKPAVLVNGSAIGWYGLWQDQPLTESAKSHGCFSHELCEAWEQAARAAEAHGVRVVCLRIGLVLGTEGRFCHADADAVRVRPWRPARVRTAMDVLDRARRPGPPDCLRHGEARHQRSHQCDRADPRDQFEIHRRTRAAPASPRIVADSGRAAAPDRRRFCE